MGKLFYRTCHQLVQLTCAESAGADNVRWCSLFALVLSSGGQEGAPVGEQLLVRVLGGRLVKLGGEPGELGQTWENRNME